MEPVMLVEVLDEHGSVQQRQRLAGAGAQSRIGRSLACDLPVDDDFAAPEHAQLTLQADGAVLVQDLGTRNGTRVDGERINTVHGRVLRSGLLRIGRTRVRLRTADGELPPERLFRRDLLQRHQTGYAVTGVVLSVLFAAFIAWTRSPGHAAESVLIAVLIALGGLALWAGTWSLVSRLTVGAWQLRIHLALAGACVAIWGWGYWIYTVAAFALQWRWIGSFTASLAALVAFAVAWRHLRYATQLRRIAALSFALLAPLLGGGLWWLADLQVDPRTVNRMEHGARILPPSLRLAPSMDLGDFIGDTAALKREANRNRQQSLLEAPILDEDD